MHQINIVLDLYSAMVCAILFIYLWRGRGKKDKLRFYFMLTCGFNIGIALGDIPSWACEGTVKDWYHTAQWCGALVFWLCTTLILLSFTAYLIEYLAPKVTVHKGFWYVALALGVLHIAGILLSTQNGMFFTITETNIYQRGSWFWLSQLIPFSIYGVDIAIFTNYRKNLTRRDFHILSSYIILPLLAEGIQILNYGISLLSAGVSLGMLIIFINIQSERELQLERQEKELAEAQIQIMLSQIQPHFLYNALTVIRRLCDIDSRQAKDAIHDFSLFLRANMNSLKSKAPIPFEQELLHVQSYLALEQRRFQNRLHIVYDITCKEFSLPPLTVQPIVENAVRHGVLKREEGGTVTIRTQEEEKAWLVIVEDDGVGIGKIDYEEENSHIGIENVRGRLMTVCSGTLQIQSTQGIGTHVTISIPKIVSGNQ